MGPAFYARREPLRWIPQWFREYGDVFYIRARLGQAVVLGVPELAREVLVERYPRYQEKSLAYGALRVLMGNGLVTSAGAFWRGQRKLVQPAFHRRRLESLCAMMVERVTHTVEQLQPVARAGRAVDLAPLLSQLTLEIIAQAMFSSDVQGQVSNVTTHITTMNEHALRLLRNPWLFLVPRRFPTPFTHRPYRALQSLNQLVHQIIQTRRRAPEAHDDLLQMLLSATEETTGQGMSDAQLRDEVMTIFVAGHETTANAMAWLLYLVSRHPHVEKRLEAEIDACWPAQGLRLVNLGEFAYARQVIEESLRVYPTIWSVGRRCAEDDELGGFHIPAGTNVIVPIFHFHWNERFWPDPSQFDPDRFAPDRRPSAEAMIYFPFGAGPRSCVGNHFALQELLIMTVLFFRHFHFQMAPGARVEPDPLITLRPKYGMNMVLSPRGS